MVTLINRDELSAALADHAVTLVHTLGADSYAALHLPGAICLPEPYVSSQAAQVLPDRNAPIVTYCAGMNCSTSLAAANKLIALGYTDVRRYRGGIEDWTSAGLPTEP